MKLYLRFGMHKNKEVIHSCQRLIDGLVIPAHILAYQSSSTGAFVCSLPKHAYTIDPMTYMLQNRRRMLRRSNGTLKPSIQKWCELVHRDLAPCLLKGSGDSIIQVSDLPDLGELAKGNYEFQTRAVSTAHADPKTKKYLDKYSNTNASKPRFVVPPYFRFAKHNDEWYKATHQCYEETKQVSSGHQICPLLLFPIHALRSVGTIESIVEDYRDSKHVLVWIDGFAQGAVDRYDIKMFRKLVNSLAGAGSSPECLYGGFMSMLASQDGLQAISHGILYTESKSAKIVPGGGGAPERYYIPRFHEFRSLSQANLILKKHPELVGGTPTADRVMGGDPDKIFYFSKDPALLRRHFLEARQEERKLLNTSSIKSVATTLRETYKQYHASVSHLPNPDAQISGTEQSGLGYLQTWADAFG